LAITGAVAFLEAGCSDVGSFPAVHDMPTPRSDTPLTPEQVKQATDALTAERDHLNTELQPVPPAPPPAAPPTTGTVSKP
jgi:hypothetical protein